MTAIESKANDNWGMCGHAKVVDFFERVMANNRLSHAYLFYGPQGTGKRTLALKLAAKLLGGSEEQVANHPDISILERETDEKTGKLKKLISIEQIRGLCERLGMTTMLGGYKVAIIKDGEWLSIEAANSLLKTLEEPYGRTVIIILVENLSRLPETIVSRSQVIRFNPVARQLIAGELTSRGAAPAEAANLAGISYGRPGIAFNLFSDPEARMEYDERVAAFFNLAEAPLYERFKAVSGFIPKGGELNQRVKALESYLTVWEKLARDLFLAKSYYGEVAHHENADQLNRLAGQMSFNKISSFIKTVHQVRQDIHRNVNPELALEHLFIVL